MTCGEVAEYFAVTERTIDRWSTEEGLPVHRMGAGKKAHKRYYRSELDSWVRNRCSAPKPGDAA